jgi:hypothetical protein
MTCPDCQAELIKSKSGALCLACGYARIGRAQPAATKAASIASTGPTVPEAVVPVVSVQQSPRRHWRLVGWITLGLLALVYLFYLRPALAAYRRASHRLGTFTTAQFDGNLEFYGSDFLSAYDSKMNFHGALDRAGRQPKAQANFDGTWSKHPYQGTALIADGQLYFTLKATEMPVIRYKQSTILVPIKVDQWHSVKTDGSIWDSVCENRKPATAGQQLALYRQLRATMVRPSPLVNLRAQHAGQTTTEFSGTVDPTHFVDLATALQQALPAGCDLNTIGFTAQDTKNLRVHYTVWTNANSDWLQLIMEDKTLGSKLTLGLHLSQYNQPVSLVNPNPVIDLNNIFATNVQKYGLVYSSGAAN